MTRAELVGREREVGALQECFEAALEGQPGVVLCRGEPGIGKTRLAEELVTLARRRGVPAAWGRGIDSAGAPPYWPWRQVLRALGDVVDLPVIADEKRLTVDLARLAPEVFSRSTEPDGDPGSKEDRFRQFDAVGRLLRQLALADGLVIVLDDAHWADQASLLLLHHVARTVNDERLLLMVNYRDTEQVHGELVAELAGEPVAKQIQLRGLAPPAVARQLASVVGRDVDTADVEHVHVMTGGNPFFVAEIGRTLAERADGASPSPLSPSVRDTVSARLTRLSPGCVELLEASSIVGREFPVAVVAAMTGLPVLTCLGILDEAVSGGLVEATSTPGEHRFVHALVRDAIEAHLATPERVRLHRRAAEVVEELHAGHLGPHLFDLARHWAVAAVEGDGARAAHWIQRAGEEAMRRLAYEEAARLFGLAADVGADQLDDVDRCHLLLALGSARHLSADLSGRLEACLEAAAIARRIGRPDLLARAALVLEAGAPAEFDTATRRLCEEALAALDPGRSALLARVRARLAEACVYLGDLEVAGPASEDALHLAEQCGDRDALVAALRARQLVRSGPDGLEERAGLAERMLAIGRETGSPATQLWAHLVRIDVAFERGDLARVARELEPLAQLAEEVRGPVAQFHVLRCQAVLAQAQARFADARRLAAVAFTTLAPLGYEAPIHVRAGILSLIGHHVGQGPESLAANGVADASADGPDLGAGPPIFALAMAFILASAGRLREAAAVYRSVGPVDAWRPMPHTVLACYGLGVAVAIAVDAADDVASLRGRLAPYRRHHVVSGAGQVAYIGPAELWLGKGARHLDLLDEAVVDLEEAVKACSVNGAVAYRVEAEYELAAALAQRARSGDVARARSLAASCSKEAQALGMAPIVVRARQLIEQPTGSRSTARLTPREREVAELVAQGLTNREIAARLYLSERTAQNHVQHILTKLGLANRSQIAVLVASQR